VISFPESPVLDPSSVAQDAWRKSDIGGGIDYRPKTNVRSAIPFSSHGEPCHRRAGRGDAAGLAADQLPQPCKPPADQGMIAPKVLRDASCWKEQRWPDANRARPAFVPRSPGRVEVDGLNATATPRSLVTSCNTPIAEHGHLDLHVVAPVFLLMRGAKGFAAFNSSRILFRLKGCRIIGSFRWSQMQD